MTRSRRRPVEFRMVTPDSGSAQPFPPDLYDENRDHRTALYGQMVGSLLAPGEGTPPHLVTDEPDPVICAIRADALRCINRHVVVPTVATGNFGQDLPGPNDTHLMIESSRAAT